jgi:hypothetical protein
MEITFEVALLGVRLSRSHIRTRREVLVRSADVLVGISNSPQ